MLLLLPHISFQFFSLFALSCNKNRERAQGGGAGGAIKHFYYSDVEEGFYGLLTIQQLFCSLSVAFLGKTSEITVGRILSALIADESKLLARLIGMSTALEL